jgi:hypothetical protein
MKTKQPWLHVWSAVTLAALAGLHSGCAPSNMKFVSYKDPYFPETYDVAFKDCAYWIDVSGDVHAVGRATQETDGGKFTQYLDVRLFWRPVPGKTFTNSTATDATLRYVVAGEKGSATYVGTGFAFPKQKSGGVLEVAIESGYLRLDSHSGEGPEMLGDTRLKGVLVARKDAGEAANMIRDAELLAAR